MSGPAPVISTSVMSIHDSPTAAKNARPSTVCTAHGVELGRTTDLRRES